LRRPDNRVEYDIWYTSNNDNVLDFITDFSELDDKLGEKVLMSPHFVYWECQKCEQAWIDKHCFGGGKYCSFDIQDKFSG